MEIKDINSFGFSKEKEIEKREKDFILIGKLSYVFCAAMFLLGALFYYKSDINMVAAFSPAALMLLFGKPYAIGLILRQARQKAYREYLKMAPLDSLCKAMKDDHMSLESLRFIKEIISSK